MLFGLFEFALRRQWCESNPIKLIERKKVVEKEIKPLSIEQTERLMSTAQARKNRDCVAAVALLLYAGIRPREVRRLRWRDIDLAENCVTIRSLCSKTGGVRHVEICRPLKTILSRSRPEVCERAVCPPNWPRRWKLIRDASGFRESGYRTFYTIRMVVPRQAFPRPAAIAGEYGASGHFPSELTLRQYVGNRQGRRGKILSEFKLKRAVVD